jgi:hypothetical protein
MVEMIAALTAHLEYTANPELALFVAQQILEDSPDRDA